MTRPRDAHPIGEPPIKIMSREVWVPVEDKAAWAPQEEAEEYEPVLLPSPRCAAALGRKTPA